LIVEYFCLDAEIIYIFLNIMPYAILALIIVFGDYGYFFAINLVAGIISMSGYGCAAEVRVGGR